MPPSLDFGFNEIENKDAYNVDRAKKLLSEAGWKDTNGDGIVDKDGKNLEVDFVYYSSRAELPIFAEAAQADAAKIGIKVNLKNVDYNVMDKLGVSGDYDLMISNIMTEQAGDPLNFLNMYWRSNIDGQNPQNSSGYSNPTYDALGDALRVEFDKSKRRDIIISMQKIIMDDAAAIIFGYPQTNIISNKSITGAKIQACDYYWLTKDWKPAN
jgi:peptide/nickel transport system substrate-binding protein